MLRFMFRLVVGAVIGIVVISTGAFFYLQYRQNRAELDTAILRACPNVARLNDDERRQWVASDEGLYNWAKREGVANP